MVHPGRKSARKGAIMRPIAIVVFLAGMAQAQEGLPPTTPTYSPPPPSGQKRTGFALEVHMGTQLVNLGAVAGTPTAIGLFAGGFFAGYKVDRFMFGLGFDIARVATAMSVPGADTSTADT